jgi:hypothetical protein
MIAKKHVEIEVTVGQKETDPLFNSVLDLSTWHSMTEAQHNAWRENFRRQVQLLVSEAVKMTTAMLQEEDT